MGTPMDPQPQRNPHGGDLEALVAGGDVDLVLQPDLLAVEDLLEELDAVLDPTAVSILTSTSVGEWKGRAFAVLVLLGDEAEVARALKAAGAAIEGWRRGGGAVMRADLIRHHLDTIVDLDPDRWNEHTLTVVKDQARRAIAALYAPRPDVEDMAEATGEILLECALGVLRKAGVPPGFIGARLFDLLSSLATAPSRATPSSAPSKDVG